MKLKDLTIYCAIGTIFSLGACDQVYFSNSQPIDSKNVYEFPKKYRGVWTDSRDSVVIGKDYFMNIDYDNKSITKSELDTSSSYVVKGNKIYQIDKDEELKVIGGFPYTLKNDTLYYQKRDIFEIAFGRNAFLRKVGDYYIINMKHRNQWWEIGLFELTNDNRILIRYFGFEDIEKVPDATIVYAMKNEKYLDVAWTKAELQKIIDKGGFSDTLFKLDISQRYPLKK